MQDPEHLLNLWANHFKVLVRSHLQEDLENSGERMRKTEELESLFHLNEEFLLNVPFTSDEVTRAVHKLKRRKSPEPDGLMAEHLKAGGDVVICWLRNIANAVIEVEAIPKVMIRGVVVQVHKGGGRDALKTDSYRGITLTSMVAKVLEFLLLERLDSVFSEAGLPHINQTAYRKDVSCADAIFATQVLIAKYLRGVSHICMCLYDLQKAFNSVEYAVLLHKLFEAGVNGKMWRLLKNWYEGGSAQVKFDGRLSERFKIGRGGQVRIGSFTSTVSTHDGSTASGYTGFRNRSLSEGILCWRFPACTRREDTGYK